MTDNGLAALATAIHVGRNHQHDPRADERPHAHLISEREQEEAAAILAKRGVFLPDGLGPVMVGMAEEIATLRDALVREVAELEKPTELHDYRQGFHRSPDCPGCMMLARLRAALAAAKGTL